MVRDDVLLITTPDEAANKLTTMVYPVADLVLPPGASSAEEADFDSLIDLITTTIQPTTWDAVGGPGTIYPFENKLSLVFSQTEEVHEEVANLLETLRNTKASAAGTAPAPRPAISPGAKRTRDKAMGGMGGMGMGGVGMGGMGGGFGGPAPAAKPSRGRTPVVSSVVPIDQDADLLGGLQQSNQSLQRKHVERLKGTYQSGMGGVGAGAAY
jgi:hypothetical protein